MSDHAFLAPSAAARWGICALSASLEAAYPETEEGAASLEGTAAHWVVERTLRGAIFAPGIEQAPNGVLITQEMIEAAELVGKAIADAVGVAWAKRVRIEEYVDIPRIHPTQCSGTPDYSLWIGARDLWIFDFKFGHGIVEVRENKQLIAYAAGLLSEAGIDGLQEQSVVVHMVIIQPRADHRDGPVRTWNVRACDIRAQINVLRNQAELATSPNPPATPHPEACKNCKGRHACEALQKEAYAVADQAQRAAALDLSPHALGLELRTLTRASKLLEARVSGLEAQAVATIKHGKLVPFWMMESTPGNLAWTKPAEEVLALGAVCGINIAKPATPITPTQAKKAGIPASLVDAYASRPPGASKLVYDDGTKARLTFGSSDT